MNKKQETEEICIHAVAFNQKGIEMFMGALSPRELLRMFHMAPNTRKSPKGVQRFIQPKKLKEIERYVQKQKGLMPGGGVVNITKDIKIKRHPDNPYFVNLVFPKVNKDILEYGKENGSYGIILDHQHTGKGVFESGIQNFKLPMVFLYKASKDLAYKIFADINSTQTPVSKVLLTRLKAKVWELNSDKNPHAQQLLDLIDKLNEDPNSVLYKKIKCYQDDKKTWVASPALIKFLLPVYKQFKSYSINLNEATDIVSNFYTALSKVYKQAWGDDSRSDYVLCKSMGFYISAIGILPIAFQRCDVNFGTGNWTVDNFVKELKGKIGKIEIKDGNGEVIEKINKFDWSSDKFGKWSNEKGVQAIIRGIGEVYKIRDRRNDGTKT